MGVIQVSKFSDQDEFSEINESSTMQESLFSEGEKERRVAVRVKSTRHSSSTQEEKKT